MICDVSDGDPNRNTYRTEVRNMFRKLVDVIHKTIALTF